MFATIDLNRVHVRLSRRNLCDLQASLDEPDVRNKFLRRQGENGVYVVVEVEEDANHYPGRDPGPGFAPGLPRLRCGRAEPSSGAAGQDPRRERLLVARRIAMGTDTRPEKLSNRAAWSAFMGVLTAAVGIVIMIHPIASAAASRVFLGSTLIVAAVVQLVVVFTTGAVRGRRVPVKSGW
jgi:hypothetical protein